MKRQASTVKCIHNLILPLLCLSLLVCSSGATCLPRHKTAMSEFQPPILFETPPSLQQITELLNRTSRVQQLQSNAVIVRFPGLPALSTTFAWRRDRFFRMQGSVTRLTGVEFDIGSNQDIFWMSSRRDVTPTLYYARHDQFEAQLNRQVLPVSPLWIVEALGLITVNPDHVTEPPQVGPDGLLRLNTILPSQAGNYYRTLHIDAKQGTVKEVMLRDPNGRLLAKATLSAHQYHAAIDASLPYQSVIEFMPVGGESMTLQVEIKFYRINENADISDSLFANPPAAGMQVIDLASLNAGMNPTVAMPAYQMPQPTAPDYRGVP